MAVESQKLGSVALIFWTVSFLLGTFNQPIVTKVAFRPFGPSSISAGTDWLIVTLDTSELMLIKTGRPDSRSFSKSKPSKPGISIEKGDAASLNTTTSSVHSSSPGVHSRKSNPSPSSDELSPPFPSSSQFEPRSWTKKSSYFSFVMQPLFPIFVRSLSVLPAFSWLSFYGQSNF